MTKWPPRLARLAAPLVQARPQQLLHHVLFPVHEEKHSALLRCKANGISNGES